MPAVCRTVQSQRDLGFCALLETIQWRLRLDGTLTGLCAGPWPVAPRRAGALGTAAGALPSTFFTLRSAAEQAPAAGGALTRG